MTFESNTLDFLWMQDGDQGVPGANGKDGQVLYTWMKYSHNADGSNMSDDSTGMEYVGIAYNKTQKTESTNPSDYSWSKIKGEQGNPGVDAYTIILDNENISFATTSSKIPLNNQTATCHITVLQGTKLRTNYVVGTITSPTGITVKESNKTISLSVSTSTAIGALSGSIEIPIQIDGFSFTKQITYSLSIKGDAGKNSVSVYLSNENHTFSATKDGKAIATQIQTNVYAYSGSTQVSTKIGDITTPTGMIMTVSNNDKIGTSISISVTTALTSNGTVDIPVIIGDNTYHCIFSYNLSKQGADGTPAKALNIIASTQIFKSTDGGVTFSPDIITLTPQFQGGLTYSKWQYSSNGGKTWVDVSSTTNGVSVSSGAISISKNSTLYTKTITSIVFKCISSNTTFYDTCTVSKLYDVIDIRDDIEAEFTQVKKSISGVEQKADKANKSITDKIWQTDITNTINNYDKNTVDDIRNRTTLVEKNLSGITSTVQDMQTTVSKKADGSKVTELTNRVAKAEQDASGFKQTVESTYAKQTDLNNLQIGGRNLIRNGKGGEKAGFFKNFDTFTNGYCGFTLKSKNNYVHVALDGFVLGIRDYNVGEKVTWSYDIMYTAWNFPSGTTRSDFWMGQRYGKDPSGATDTGSYRSVTSHRLPEVGVNGCVLNKWYHVVKTITIPEQASTKITTTEAYIQFCNKSDTEASFSARIKNVKLEKGDKATDWTPAPEDTDEAISNVNKYTKTSFEQLSDKFSWLVTSNSSKTSLTLTDSVISAITKQFIIKDSDGSATIIEGGKIKANSITSKMLSSDALKSNNYKPGSYTNNVGYSKTGTFIDLSTGIIHTPTIYTDANGDSYINGHITAKSLTLGSTMSLGTVSSGKNGFSLSKDGLLKASNAVVYGSIYASSGEFSGKITATSGTIGGFALSSNTIQNGTFGTSGSVMMSTGTLTSKSIGGSADTINGWCFTAGENFGVTKTGILYASGVNISGKITATSGTIGGCSISSSGKLTIPAANITGTLKSNQIAAGAITADKIKIGDFTNYSDLDINTYEKYGFTLVADGNNNPWFQHAPQRDIPITPITFSTYSCQGGETFYISFEVSSTVKATTVDGGGTNDYVNIKIGLYGKNTKGESVYKIPTGYKSNSSGSIQKVTTTVTLPTDVRSFSTCIRCSGSGTFSGTLKIRNISVRRMVDDALIVNGSITADKITTSNIVGKNGWINLSNGTFNYGSGKFVWDGTNATIGTWSILSNGLAIKDVYGVPSTGGNSIYYYSTFFGSSKIRLSSPESKDDFNDGNGYPYTFFEANPLGVFCDGLYIGASKKKGTTTNGIYSQEYDTDSFAKCQITSEGMNINKIVISDSLNLSSSSSFIAEGASHFIGNVTLDSSMTIAKTLTASGNVNITGKTTMKGNCVIDGTFYFVDWGMQDNNTVLHRQPVASITEDGKRVAYLSTIIKNDKLCLRANGQYGTTGGGGYKDCYFYNDAVSDIRLKKNIGLCKINALNAVTKMKICSFDWKDTNKHQSLGLIADELEKIDPLLCLGGEYDEDGNLTTKCIDRLLLTEYAIKAIQEQQEIIKFQQNQIHSLEQKLMKINILISSLED